MHLTTKILDHGYGLGRLRLKPWFETEPKLYFILRSAKPQGLVMAPNRFNQGNNGLTLPDCPILAFLRAVVLAGVVLVLVVALDVRQVVGADAA